MLDRFPGSDRTSMWVRRRPSDGRTIERFVGPSRDLGTGLRRRRDGDWRRPDNGLGAWPDREDGKEEERLRAAHSLGVSWHACDEPSADTPCVAGGTCHAEGRRSWGPAVPEHGSGLRDVAAPNPKRARGGTDDELATRPGTARREEEGNGRAR